MKVGIDSRAAIWYRGTGMGTYTYQLIRNIYLIDKKNEYNFYLPNERFFGTDPITSGVFQSISQTKERFWEMVVAVGIDPVDMDVYHVPQNGIGLPEKKRCPTVVTVHDLIPYILPETVGPNYLEIFRQEMPRILSETQAIITVSEHSKKDLVRLMGIDPDRITVIYEAPESTYKEIRPEIAKARIANKYGISGKFVLYLGGFSPRKNIPNLLRAFAKIRADLPETVFLVIVGRHSPNFAALFELVEKLGLGDSVIFPGFAPVQDLPFLYNAASLFVYPSFYEGFGLPPLEAMACGTPTIIANCSSLPEIADKGAKAVDPHDIDAIAKAMFEILTKDKVAADLRKAGLSRAAEFSWTKTAAQTIKVYQSLMANR